MTMTETDARDHTNDVSVIPGYGENPPQAAPPPAPGPPADAGGDIAAVGQPRDPRLLKEKCNVAGCGKLITKKNMDQHKRNVHGIYKRKRGAQDAPAPAAEPEKTIKRARLTADEIVLIVVQMRWPGGVPINKVATLLEWQRDTERFMSE